VILFAGTSDCVIIPITSARQTTYDHALKDLVKFLDVHAGGNFFPSIPTDNRCVGCPYGLPRKFQQGKSETISNGKPLPAYSTNSYRPDGELRGEFHSTCGDRFRWVPSHKDAIALGIAKEPGNPITKTSK